MNLCDCFVKRVHGIPHEKYGKWWIAVSYASWGTDGRIELMFGTFEEANSVREGFKFLA